jgi:hypothetical protein
MKNKVYICEDSAIKVEVISEELIKLGKSGKLNKKYILVRDLDTGEYAGIHEDIFKKTFREYTDPDIVTEEGLVNSILEDLKETFGIDDLDPEDIIIRKL